MAPLVADADLQARVKPITLTRYSAAVITLVNWARSVELIPSSSEEWDDLLLEFRYAHADRLTRSKFVLLVTALEFYMPNLKRQLAWSHALLTGWARRGTIKHTVPLGKRAAFLIAIHLVAMGYKRLAAGLLLQVHTGLRPSEMLGILPEHLLFSEDQGAPAADLPLVIALGVRFGTKVQRTQVAILRQENSELIKILRACKAATSEGFYLFPHTLTQYRSLLRTVERKLGLNVGWSPHGPRAGFASDARLAGWAFEEIREAGRWQSDSSLRTYLDIVASAAVVRSMRQQGMARQLEVAERVWPSYFRA